MLKFNDKCGEIKIKITIKEKKIDVFIACSSKSWNVGEGDRPGLLESEDSEDPRIT